LRNFVPSTNVTPEQLGGDTMAQSWK